MKSFKKLFTQLAISVKLTISKLHLYLLVKKRRRWRQSSFHKQMKTLVLLFRWRLWSNIQSLDNKRSLSSEVLDGVFEFVSRKPKCVESLSNIAMKAYATEPFNANYLKKNWPEHANNIIIYILEKNYCSPLLAT